ncbi:Flp family type IVb pilin [Roseovarius sp.]|uniref:Flp family type IVb pilin n=1 Tax=Roseovarius sp. TaxID=1486281 RepID=UPI003BA882FE
MIKRFNTFLEDESGAVTVDWIVLSAAVVGLGIAAVNTVELGVTSLASDIATAIGTKTVDNGN